MQKVYIGVMNDMKTKFDKRELSSEQKTATTRVIVETQALLATHSFRVLGLERGHLTSREVFAVLMAHREAGNMTAEQNSAMDNLSEVTQIHMVQGIIDVFDYTPEEAASKYGTGLPEMISLLHRPTFAPAGTHSHRTASPASNLLDAAEVQRVFINMYENGELTRALETEANSVMTMLQVMMVQGAVKASNYSTVEAAARFNTSFATMEELMQKPSTGCIDEKEIQNTDLNAPCSFDDFHCMEDDQCIPSHWTCDGQEDCRAGQDEDPHLCMVRGG